MKFDMSRAWNDATAMISANREVLTIVAGIFFFLPAVALAFVMPDPAAAIDLNTGNMDQLQAMMLDLYAQYWWIILLVYLAQMVGYLALLTLLSDDRNPTVADAIQTGLLGLLPAIGTYIVFVIGVSIAFAALLMLAAVTGLEALAALVAVIGFVGIIYLSVKASLLTPIIAIERVFNPFKVLARSWQLTKGNSVRLFGFYVLIVIVYFVISIVMGIAVLALSAAGDTIGSVANALFSGLAGAVVTVVFVAVLAAIHRQLAGPTVGNISETFE